MNRVIGFYGNNPLDLEHLVRESIKCGYKQPIIYTSYKNHTAYTKQFEIQMANNINHAKELLIKRFGRRADFGVLSGDIKRVETPIVPSGPKEVYESDVIISYIDSNSDFIDEAINSILYQCNVNTIIHIIFDGPTVENSEVYEKYKQYSNIRFYQNKSSGPYIAINRIYKYFETDFITIMDADDISLPNRIWKAIDAIYKDNADAYSAAMEQFVDPRYSNKMLTDRLQEYPITESCRKGSHTPNGDIVHGTLTIKKDVFARINGYGDLFCGADTHLAHRLDVAGYKIHHSKEIAGLRRLHNASLTNNNKYGLHTKVRRDIHNKMRSDYENIAKGHPPNMYGSLHKYIASADVNKIGGTNKPNKIGSAIRKPAIISCYYNPCHYKNLYNNCKKFLENLGHDVTLVELSYDGRFDFKDSIHIRGDIDSNFMWQKERLINIGIESQPDDVDAVIWLDADIIFENKNWLQETIDLLEYHPVVQPYQKIYFYDSNQNIARVANSISHQRQLGLYHEPGTPGGAWAARIDAIPNGIYDKDIVGGNDVYALSAWIPEITNIQHRFKSLSRIDPWLKEWQIKNSHYVDGNIGCTNGILYHMFHGTRSNRQYGTRTQILNMHNFHINDIIIDDNGLWAWNSKNKKLHNAVAKYFLDRKEDTP